MASIGSWITPSSVTLPTSTETIVVSTGSVSLGEGSTGQGVLVSGVVNLTTGTGTTAIVVTVRAGTHLTGAIIGNQLTVTVTAGSNYSIPFEVIDPTLTGSVSYTVTIAQTGASANGTVNQGNITITTIESF